MCKNPPLFAMEVGIWTEEWHFFLQLSSRCPAVSGQPPSQEARDGDHGENDCGLQGADDIFPVLQEGFRGGTCGLDRARLDPVGHLVGEHYS